MTVTKTQKRRALAPAKPTYLQPDTTEAREYNRVRRWLEIGDLAISFGFLIALLATGWTKTLSGLATRMGGDHYALDLFFYVLFLSVISKVLGISLDFYSFRLERRFNLSNQRLTSWIKDQVKGWMADAGFKPVEEFNGLEDKWFVVYAR